METSMASQPKQAEAQHLRTYSHDELWRIRANMWEAKWYKTLSVETIKTIRKLGSIEEENVEEGKSSLCIKMV